MKNSLFIISKLCMLAFILLLAQGCQEDYEMIDPPMMTDYDDDLDVVERFCRSVQEYDLHESGEICHVRRKWTWCNCSQECKGD